MERCADRALAAYERLTDRNRRRRRRYTTVWATARARIRAEWHILKNLTRATGAAINKKTE